MARDASGFVARGMRRVGLASYGWAIHIELTWESCGDLDLHYTAPGENLCDAKGLGHANPSPDWGCANSNCSARPGPFPDGNASDDAVLVTSAGSGSCGVVHPEVKIYLSGQLALDRTLGAGLDAQEAWLAADIDVADAGTHLDVEGGGSPVVVDPESCPGF